MSTTPAPDCLRAFITQVLACSDSRVMAVAYLRAAAQERRKRRVAMERDRAEAVNFEVLADLYAHADGPYPEVEENWRDMAKYHSRPLTYMDAPVGSPANMCAEG